MDYTATYSPDDNKLRLHALSRLPKELYDRVHAAGFIWAPKQKFFVCPAWSPKAEDMALELAGDIGDEDTSLIDRAEVRAERFEGYSDKRGTEAERAYAGVESIASGIPLGQPILVGHHSEKRARRDAERIENGMRKAVNLWETSKYWTSRAAGAIRHAKYKELPGVRARRIKGLEADKRKSERNRDEAQLFLKLWQSETLTRDKAIVIANRDYCSRCYPLAEFPRDPPASQYEGMMSVYSALTGNVINETQARDVCVAAHLCTIAYQGRWISHIENRLVYEKAMLEVQGESRLLDKKPRPTQLPLCNYKAPDGLKIPNRYHRGQVDHYPQIEMTSAEYTRINRDYKSTHVLDNSHRVRTTMLHTGGTRLVCVFLTDSKVHKRPGAVELVPPPVREFHTREYKVPEPTKFDALKDSLRAGVKAISAPQLFVTQPVLAREIVAKGWPIGLAGKIVLDPSAGTGNLIRAVIDSASGADCVRTVAVEIDHRLCDLLEQERNKTFGANELTHKVVRKDFLQCNGDLGKFDAIVMNPPFADGQDMHHVEHALHMLKPGGRLVAVMSPGFTFRQDRQASAFRELMEERRAVVEPLPDDSFKASGTSVRTVLVTIDG